MGKIKPKQESKEEISRDRKLQMCVWFAQMKTAEEIQSLAEEHYGFKVSRQRVWKFSKAIKWSKIIRFLKKRILTNLLSIPIANKSIRLNYLQAIYREAMTKSLKSINQWGTVYELKLGAAVEAIKAAREEIESSGLEKDNKYKDEELEILTKSQKYNANNRIASIVNSN